MRSPKPSAPPPIGHNEFSFDTRDDLPDEVKKTFHFFKCDTDALLRDVLKMPLKERGFYLTAILLMYRDLEGLPANDKAAAMAMHIDVREYRPLKKLMLQPGLLHEKPSGRVSNARFEREICAYVMQHRQRSEAAAAREAEKKKAQAERQQAKQLAETRDVSRMSGGSPGDLREDPRDIVTRTGEDNSKKINDFNGGKAETDQRETTRGGENKNLELELRKVSKNLSQPAIVPGETLRAGGPDELPGLNGATAMIVTDVAKWLSPWTPDEPGAYKQIGEAIRIYGERAVRDGYAEMKADIADGKIRAPSVKSLYGYFRIAKDRPPSKTAGGKPPLVNSKGWVRT